jgi:dimethylamine--corrinoid protein Co-methyltransferase
LWDTPAVYGALGKSVEDVTGPVVRNELRRGLDLGRVNAVPGAAKGIDARFRIAELLDIESNSLERFKERTRW